MTDWTTKDIASQSGKLAVITGATGGLGYETALALAATGAEVILTGRHATNGRDALDRIHAHHPHAKARFELLDLAKLASVAEFSRRINAAGRPLDLLINNAGVMAMPTRKITADGFEMQLGTNYLGHFALTAHMLPLLCGPHRARVVNLASLAHRFGHIDFDDLQGSHAYRPWKAYAQSKLAMLQFAIELQRRSDAKGWGLQANAAHPGFARTALIANGPGTKGVMGALSGRLVALLSQSAAAGALPTLFAATSPRANAAGYYGPDGFYEIKGSPAPAKIAPQASDAKVTARLWELSNALTGARWDAPQGRRPVPLE